MNDINITGAVPGWGEARVSHRSEYKTHFSVQIYYNFHNNINFPLKYEICIRMQYRDKYSQRSQV